MIVDGKYIADQVAARVHERVRALGRAPRLALLSCAPSFSTATFVKVKKRRAAAVGVDIIERELPSTATTDDALAALGELIAAADGVVIQLPFPRTIDVEALFAALPASHDVDAVGVEAHGRFMRDEGVLPPVVGAIAEIATQHAVSFRGMRATVVGRGRLVGAPAAVWLARQGADVTVCDRTEPDLASQTYDADILVLGAGVPGLITPDMIKKDVVIFDAGTSEEAGKLAGDADPACAYTAALFTPVPGGIGPITVAKLFENLVKLIDSHGRRP